VIRLIPDRLDHVVVLGAHCDDIAIGAGGSLLQWARERPGLRVSALVFTGAGGIREKEERAALAALCPDAHVRVDVLDLPDAYVPAHWERAKAAVGELATELSLAGSTPDLVLAPALGDAHQDHRTLARLAPTAFRDHLVLGYEIPKFDSDLAQPTVFVPLAEDVLSEKLARLAEHYPSQAENDWFEDETFAGLARLRGVQCHERCAEAFHVDKLILGSGSSR
jgi:LmbE family N-acetylglucosaminyl deacetylase